MNQQDTLNGNVRQRIGPDSQNLPVRFPNVEGDLGIRKSLIRLSGQRLV